MANRTYNTFKLRKEMESADAVINPLLAKAGIQTIQENGATIPANEASIPARIAALAAVNPPGEKSQDNADLLVTNAQIAERLEKTESDLAVANATIGSLQAEKRDLTTRAETAESSVNTLTAEKAQLNLQLKSAESEFARVNKENISQNTELSKACLAVHCLDLRDEKNNPLPATASPEQRQAAADKVSFKEKLTAYQGAVNLAVSRIGVSVSSVPGAAPAAPAAGSQESILLAKLNSTSDPIEKAKLRKQYAEAIRAGFKPVSQG